MIISPFSRVLRIFLWPVVIVFAWSGTTLAQTSPAERYQAVEKGWLAGDFEAIGAGWEADSSLYLAPAAPRPKNDQDVLLLAKLLRRIADTQQELARPDREALVWQTLLLWQADKTGPPDSLELEIRGQLLRFQALDEAFYNLPDTAALYFGVGSYHHRKAVYLAVMKAYNEGADDAVDSLLALAPAMATSTTYYDSIEQAFLQRMHGIQAMAATDYGAARRWFATALAQCPVSPGAYQPRSLLRLDLADAYRAAAVYDSAHWQLDTVAEELALLTPELLQLKGLYHLRRAMTYRSANQLRLAATSLQEADRHFAAYPLSRSYQADLMLTRSTLASVRRQRQDWQGAAEAYLRCIELAQARREPNSLQLLGLNLNYAGVQGLCGNFAGGLATAEQALQLSRERFGETHLYVAVALNTMAENLIGLGRFAEAEQYALQSLAIRKELYPPGHERLMYPNNVLARLLEEAGRPAEGLVYRRRVVDICTGKYGLTAANCREQRIDLVRGLVKADDPVRATEALRALNDDFPPDLPLSESDNPAFDIAQLYLQGLLGENILPGVSPFAPAIDRFNAVQFGFDAEEASILLAGEYGDVFRQQAMLDYQRVGPPVNRLKAWESVARLKYNALWRFRHERAVRNRLLPADLQERLGQQEQALVEAQGLRRASRRIPGQVASDSLARLVDRVSVLEADLSQLKDSIRRRFPDYTASRFELPQVDWSALQAKLEPSERIIEFFWADSLVIVFSYSDEGLEVMDFKLPDDGANAVDAYYTAVSTGKTDATPPAFLSEMTKYLKRLKEYDLTIITDGPLSRISWAGMPLPNDQFLIEAKSIKYAWSLYEWLPLPFTTNKTYPVYGVFPQTEAGLPSREAEWAELQKIVALQLDSGRYWAEEQTLPVGIWHFATHAFADFNQPTNTYLILPGEEERLFVPDLRVQEEALPLVVLSACETGTGRWQPGEGANSMARAFARAGASTTLTTLWKVPDAAAATITTAFYKHLAAGQKQEHALLIAQQEYLLTVDDPRQRAPFYWAGFVLTGQGGEVRVATPGSGLIWWFGGLGLIVLGITAKNFVNRNADKKT